ncbi:MAG TPA: hypothetical protein VGM56_30810 [Byssovorax sp.]
MILGVATVRELVFVCVLLGLVLLAPIAPRVGAAIGGLFQKRP